MTAFTCPFCGWQSANVGDIRSAWCGSCQVFTAEVLKTDPKSRPKVAALNRMYALALSNQAEQALGTAKAWEHGL